jgi:hypothetical protein
MATIVPSERLRREADRRAPAVGDDEARDRTYGDAISSGSAMDVARNAISTYAVCGHVRKARRWVRA